MKNKKVEPEFELESQKSVAGEKRVINQKRNTMLIQFMLGFGLLGIIFSGISVLNYRIHFTNQESTFYEDPIVMILLGLVSVLSFAYVIFMAFLYRKYNAKTKFAT